MATLFDRQKAEKLRKNDLSRKGSVDAPIVDYLRALNAHPDYVSLSSCSGRIIIFVNSDNLKKGCTWILVKHEAVDVDDDAWTKILEHRGQKGICTLKFEPFILHVQCRHLEAAKTLQTLASEVGFRNSGFTYGKSGKVVLAIRSTHGLQVPLSDEEGQLLVEKPYVDFLIQQANAKLAQNAEKILKLEKSCQLLFGNADNTISDTLQWGT